MNNGQTKPGYNVQIATENQIITNYHLYWRPTDFGTMIPFLESFKDRYGRQSEEIVADSGYGNEENYEYMWKNGMVPYVKYPMFHAEMKRKYVKNPFLSDHLFYNKEEDFYVCPMGQRMDKHYLKHNKSELGYRSASVVYTAENCIGCPLRGMCYKSMKESRSIEANHQGEEYREKARELLTSERGLHHRSNRPVEPEAVFGDIQFNHGFKRFHMKGHKKVTVEFCLIASAHNLRIYSCILKENWAYLSDDRQYCGQ